MTKKILSQVSGLTLVELMIVLGLSVLLVTAAWLSYNAQYKGGRVQEQTAVMQQDLRAVMDIMEKDIRNAGCDPCFSDFYHLIQGTTGLNALGVRMDLLTVNCTSTVAPTTVVYKRVGNTLQRDGQTLVSNVITFGLTYWDADGNLVNPTALGSTLTTSEITRVRSVDINVVVRSAKVDPDTNAYFNRSMQRRVRMRN